MRQDRKNRRKRLGLLTGQNAPKSNFFCQQNLTKPQILAENRNNYSPQNMKLGENGGRMAMLGGALAAGLAAGAPEQAEAQDFNSYCAPLANGEVLEMTLDPNSGLAVPTTPDGPHVEPVFRDGQVTQQGFDAHIQRQTWLHMEK